MLKYEKKEENPLDEVEPFVNIPMVETKSGDMKGKGEKR